MTKPYYELSEIDNLFFDIFGVYPPKEGQAYEKIVGAVLKILNKDSKIIWDERKTGQYDENSYQIDVGLYSIDGKSVMVEAKDHTKYSSKVTRPELDKIAGSLIELNFKTGMFFSATGYTRDAKRKSIGSSKNPSAKKISLYHLSRSVIADRNNRFEKFILRITSFQLDKSKTVFNPVIPDDEYNKYFSVGFEFDTESLISYDETSIRSEGILLDDNKRYIGKIEFSKNLDKSIFRDVIDNELEIAGRWEVEDGFIEVNCCRSPIIYVDYKIRFNEVVKEIEISTSGDPVLLIESEDGSMSKLITDEQLKKVVFEADGTISYVSEK